MTSGGFCADCEYADVTRPGAVSSPDAIRPGDMRRTPFSELTRLLAQLTRGVILQPVPTVSDWFGERHRPYQAAPREEQRRHDDGARRDGELLLCCVAPPEVRVRQTARATMIVSGVGNEWDDTPAKPAFSS